MIVLFLAGLHIGTQAYGANGVVQLAWALPTTNTDGTPLTDLAGVRIYYGTASQNYAHVIDVGLTNACSIQGLQAGTTYYLNGKAYNAAGLESDFCQEVVKAAGSTETNAAPVVSAGPAGETMIHELRTALQGQVTDDGRPAGSSLTVAWSLVSGPGTVVFANPNAAATQATFGRLGKYTLRLTASDGEKTSSDDVLYFITWPPPKASIQ